jgi:hypothetical protein
MLKQIRGHWYKPTYPFFFSDINYIDKKIDQIILEQVPCLRNFMKKMTAILATISCVDKKTSRPTEHAQHCGITFKILCGYHF